MHHYNPNIHNRRSIRLKGYDYSQAGLYFITICCQDRAHLFGNIENGEMKLNAFGKIAWEEWLATEKIINLNFKIWQRNYYEHIIRNEQAYYRIANYIINNPKNWKEDKFHK